jgi:hypothetical protein
LLTAKGYKLIATHGILFSCNFLLILGSLLSTSVSFYSSVRGRGAFG